MTTITQNLILQFIDLALSELTGEWIIIGGAVPHLLGSGERPTLDIDLAGPDSATQADTLKLMAIAEKLGLPIESINQAASFFLKRIPDWQSNLVIIRSNTKCKIFRPNIELFFKLKLQRASESDVLDLMSMWKLEADKEKLRARISEICESCIKSADQPVKARVETLRSLIRSMS
jgi:hypothetical protein